MSSVKTKPLWSCFGLSLLAAVFTAVYRVMDNVTMHNFVVVSDSVTAVSAYFIFAGWIGVVSSLGFSTLFGQRLVDSKFRKLNLAHFKAQGWAMLAGCASAGSTFFVLWANRYLDPGTIIALASMLILFTSVYDVVTKEVKLGQIAIPLLLVVTGGVMASYTGSIRVTLLGLFLVGILSNSLGTISMIAEQKGTRKTDGVNFFFWRFLWLATIGTIGSIVIALARDQLPALVSTIAGIIRYVPWFVLTMFFVFLGKGLELTAIKVGAITVVLMILSSQMVLGYTLTFIGNAFIPGLFGDIPTELAVWVIRILGATILIAGIFRLRKIA